jgi:sulfate permease, SulP family
MPSAGGFSQTAINQKAGARTQLSELVTVALAIGCALFLGSILSDLPQATLGCMVVVAVLGLIQPAEFVRYWRLSRIEFWVAVVTAGSGLLFGLLPAVFVGVVLTLFLVLIELDRLGVTELEPTPGDADVEVAGTHTSAVPGLLMLRIDGPLYTANVRAVNRKIITAVEQLPGTSVVILDGTALAYATLTVVDEFAELEHRITELGAEIWIVALPPRALELARQTPRWEEYASTGRVFPTSLAAVKAFRMRST